MPHLLAERVVAELPDRRPVDDGIVVQRQDSVRGELNVELDAVPALVDRGEERLDGVFARPVWRTTMAEDEGSHGPNLATGRAGASSSGPGASVRATLLRSEVRWSSSRWRCSRRPRR